MSRNEKELEGVTLLGNKNTSYAFSYTPEVLETFENKHPDNDYMVTFDAYEFTSKCVVGDTLIDVATNETEHPHGVPIKDLVGTEGYVFGVNDSDCTPVCKKYHDVRKTGEKVPVVKIIMDVIKHNRRERAEIICTPDHQILTRPHWHQTEWVQAKDLKPGDHLIADQRSGDIIRYQARHRLIGEAIFGKDNIKTIHHIDGNHYNNSPDNLANLTLSEHSSLHRTQDYGYAESLNVDELIDLYNNGENISSLAKKYNCDTSTILSRLNGKVIRRTQSESLKLKHYKEKGAMWQEMITLYETGYTYSEIAEYFDYHPTTVRSRLLQMGVKSRESNYSRHLRNSLDLPSLNHRVIEVVDAGFADVYNMEVEDIHNYFANGVVVHNCPKTGQPDFAKVYINYIPNERMVESKSLKLYLFSFRNHGDFHEDCMNIIMKDLIKLMDPKYIEVLGIFSPRGGISIFPFCNYAQPGSIYEDYKVKRMFDMSLKLTGTHYNQ